MNGNVHVRFCSRVGVATSRLRQRPQAQGTQVPITPTGRVQLSLVNVQGGGGKGKREEPLSREPYAMKVARTVLTGGMERRAGRDRVLSLPTQE